MKFAAPYQFKNCTIDYDLIDEFNILFTEHSSYDDLRKFLQMYPNHRVNIEYEEGYNVEYLYSFFQEHDNLYWRMKNEDLVYLQECQEQNIKFFFDETLPIYSYSLLEWVLDNGPTDIYILDDLTYNLEEVKKQCLAHNISLRIVLNKVPTMSLITTFCPSAQIYRPQDYDYLSEYYDVGEFDCGDTYDWTKAEVLYRHWYVDHDWNDDLNIMNIDLTLPYPTKSIPPELTRLRSKCKHRCTLYAENMCQKCRRLLEIGYSNVDNNLVYRDSDYGLPSLEDMTDLIIISKDDNL